MPDTDSQKIFDLSQGPLGRSRQLILRPDGLSFDGHEIARDVLTDVIYESEWIRWYRFTIGQSFRISLKTEDGSIIRVNFSSYFGTHNEYGRYYSEITGYIGTFYLLDLVNDRVSRVLNGDELDAAGLKITSSGLRHPKLFWSIPWPKAGVHEYYDYLRSTTPRLPTPMCG
ncbi:MAG TPA: hypothetical protein VD816_09990 [Ohtaekwangia sp.]|nr:hypothetical protein [Ohtaekwangia sp.]